MRFIISIICYFINIVIGQDSFSNTDLVKQYTYDPFQVGNSIPVKFEILFQEENQSITKYTPLSGTCNKENDTIQIQPGPDPKSYLGLEYMKFQIQFQDMYDFLKVEFSFIKFKRWGTENLSFIFDSNPVLLGDNSQGNPDKYCGNYSENSTLIHFSNAVIPQVKNNSTIIIKSRANLPERQWSIMDLNFYLYKCKDKYAFNKQNFICDSCSDYCDSCSSSSICLRCSDNYFLHQGACLQQCQDGWFGNEGVCKSCQNFCKECSSLEICNECIDSNKDPQNKCQTCSNNLKLNPLNNNECIKCEIQDCQTIDSQICKCIEKTPLGKCKDYKQQCLDFSDTSNCQCSICKKNYYLDIDNKDCISQCPQGQTLKDKIQCVSCGENCSSCSIQNNNIVCQTCTKDYFLQTDNKCISKCLDQQFSKGQQCYDCDSNCLSCNSCDTNTCINSPQSICTSCKNNKYMLTINDNSQIFFCLDKIDDASSMCSLTKFPYLLTQQDKMTCKQKCGNIQQIEIPQKICKLCEDQNCSQCTANYQQCEICNKNYYLKEGKCVQECEPSFYVKSQQKCVNNCESGYYQDGFECLICPQSYCQNCNATECQLCKNSYFLNYKKQCVSKCEDGYFNDKIKSPPVCTQCSLLCKTCSQQNVCITCSNSLYLYQGSCYSTCPSNTYIYQNTCQSKCPDGYYQDELNLSCKACSIFLNCENCTQNECTKCQSSYLLDLATKNCVNPCPLKTFANWSTNTCQQCQPQCDSCKNGIQSCTSCPEQYFLINGNCTICPENEYYDVNSCVKECEKGYGGINNFSAKKCIDCSDQNCYKCTFSVDTQYQKCTKCKSGYFLNEDNNSCVTYCPDLMYNDTVSQKCQRCSPTCKNCSQFNNCTSCITGLYLQGDSSTKTCVSICADYYYLKDDACKKCSQNNCISCDENNCYKCDKNSILVNNSCVACPSALYLRDSNCQFCEGSYLKIEIGQCVKKEDCQTDYFIDGNLCTKCKKLQDCQQESSKEEMASCSSPCSSCKKGLYLENNFCKTCRSGCQDCTNQGECVKCDSQYCLLNGKCLILNDQLSSCSQINFNECKVPQSDQNGICLQCYIDDKSSCQICDSNSFLYKSECFLKCPNKYLEDRNKYDKKKIYSGICREECLKDYILVKGEKCFTCPEKCKNCEAIENNDIENLLQRDYSCNSCNQDATINHLQLLIYTDSTTNKQIYDCVSECPVGYAEVDKKCVSCNANCQQCSNTPISCNGDSACQNNIKCTECKIGFFLNSDQQCSKVCGDGYYPDYQNKICQNCENSNFCKKCSSSTYCEECKDSFLYNHKCYQVCPFGYSDLKTNSCQPCFQNCSKCINSISCDKCMDDTYLQVVNNSQVCLPSCQTGFYPSKETQSCLPCQVQNCSSCTIPNACNTCIDSYFLLNSLPNSNSSNLNTCVQDCPEKYYKNNKLCEACSDKNCKICPNGVCNQCLDQYYLNAKNECSLCQIKNCTICQNDGLCKTCQNKFYSKEKTECVENCGNYYYPEYTDLSSNNGGICNKCIQNCIDCIDNNNCRQCDLGYYFDNTSKLCKQCEKLNCQKCQDNKCEICKDRFLLVDDTYECVEVCPDGYLQVNKNESQKICQKCKDNCKTCNLDQNNSLICSVCKQKYLLQLDTLECVSECKNGYGLDQQKQQCFNCILNCSSCEDQKSCLKCQDNYFVSYDNENKNQSCRLCESQNCLECSQQSNICKQCKDTFFLKIDTSNCVNKCPDAYATNILSKQCVKCQENCTTCSLLNDSLKCSQCLDGYYLDSNQECIKCDISSCKNCTENSKMCQQCIDSYYLLEQKFCIEKCPIKFFAEKQDGVNKCSKCIENCHECLNRDSCLSCENGFKLSENSNQCSICQVQNCENCSNSIEECIKCSNGMYLSQNSKYCLKECEIGYYPLEDNGIRQCAKCQDNCIKCTSRDSCIQCLSGYKQNENNSQCLKCEVLNCDICSNQVQECTSCQNGMYLNQDKNECLQVCSIGTFPSEDNGIKYCKKCIDNCVECTNGEKCSSCKIGYNLTEKNDLCQKCEVENCQQCSNSLSECTVCSNQLYLSQNKTQCLDKCEIGYYSYNNQDIKECRKCLDNCIECINGESCMNCSIGYKFDQLNNQCLKCLVQNCLLCQNSIDECTQCNDGMFLSENKKECLKNCEDGYYQIEEDNGKKQCKKCYDNCFECVSGESCNICELGYRLNENKSQCEKCLVQDCEKCKTSIKECQKCKNDLYLSENYQQCLPECEIGYYSILKDEINQCKKCSTNCIECSSNNTCNQCQEGYYKSQQDNIIQCNKCNQGCKNCSSQNQCSECESPLELNNQLQVCMQICGLESTKKCACANSDKCLKCNPITKQCIECQQGYENIFDSQNQKITQECIKICDKQKGQYPKGDECITCTEKQYFDDIIKECKNCIEGCQGCTVSDKCDLQKCEDNYYYKDGICVKCMKGEYLEKNSTECKSCMKGCDQCLSSNDCNECQKGLIFDKDHSMCVLICDKELSLCKEPNCKKWNIIDDKCIICNEGFTKETVDGKEICKQIQCKLSQFISIKGECIDCDPKCQSCSQSPTNCTSCQEGFEKVEIDGSNDLFTCKEKYNCHYSCITCSNSSIDSCLTCDESTRTLYYNRCICKDGYEENVSSSCQKSTSDGKGLEEAQSGLSSISAVFSIGGGSSFGSSMRGLETSQMVSFLTYVNVEYEGKSDMYLRVLYSDNLSPILPNILSSQFQVSNNTNNQAQNPNDRESSKRLLEQVYVEDYQQTEYKFMKNNKTNNFLYNISPIILLHIIVAFILLVKFLVFKYTKLQYSKKALVVWVKHNFRMSVFLIVFYLVYQELLFITLLQLSNPFNHQASSIVGSSLTLFALAYIIYLLYFIVKVTLFMPYVTVKEKAQKYGFIFSGLKESKWGQIYILAKIIQNTIICISTIYLYKYEQIIPQLVTQGILLLFIIIMRPFPNYLLAATTILLNTLYFSLLLIAYFIKSEQNNLENKQKYSTAYENTLLTFIIVKNVIVVVDIILFIYGFIKIMRAQRMRTESNLDKTITDLENSLSKSITWRNNPLFDNVYSVKLGKQEPSDLSSEYRSKHMTSDSLSTQNESQNQSKQGSPNEKKQLVTNDNNSPQKEVENFDPRVSNQVFLGKETLVIKWKKNQLYNHENKYL